MWKGREESMERFKVEIEYLGIGGTEVESKVYSVCSCVRDTEFPFPWMLENGPWEFRIPIHPATVEEIEDNSHITVNSIKEIAEFMKAL
jgi:hypothetical protein